jgi:hypothetical protein
MDFLQSLLPTEWILRLFKPDEDTEPGASIYLHIKDDDVTFRFRNDVSRYDVVEFIKEIHDDNLLDGEHNELVKQRISTLFLIDNTLSERLFLDIYQQFKCFQRTEVIFMRQSSIEIEHTKGEDGTWLTSIYKKYNGSSDNPIALITTKQSSNMFF